MDSNFLLEALTEPKKPSRLQSLLLLLAQLSALMDESPEGEAPKKDGTGPEIYVAPRYSPSP